MKDKKGFTLVELLAVVVIMGIIIGISIPAVTAVQKRLVKQRVTTFFRIVDESTDAYVEQYHTDFEKTRDCFEIDYKELIDQGLLKESDITCLSEAYTGVEGKVIATRVNGGDTFTYTHYLTCYDKETNKPLVKSEQIPEGCIGIRGGFSLDVQATNITPEGGNKEYVCTNGEGCWVSGSIKYNFSSTSPYYYPIKEFQYRTSGEIKWESISSSENDNGEKVFPISESDTSVNMNINFRAVDTGNNLSSENGIHYIRIDNTVPKANIIYNLEGWQKENITVNFTTNEVPSGIKKFYVELNDGTTRTVEVEGNVAQYIFENDFNGTIRVKAESNTGIIGEWSDTKTINLDKSAPTCTINKTSDGTKDGVSLTVVCSDEGSSGCDNQSYTGVKSTTTYTVTDGAGNTGTCTATITPTNYTRSRTRSCNYYRRCSSAGCETYNSCSNAACGCATYNSCRLSVCGCQTYRYCQHSNCGTETRCNSSSGLGCDAYGGNKSCAGCTPTGQGGSTWGICVCTFSCRTAACGCETYNSCRNSSCGCQAYNSCRTSGCGCQTYNRGSSCGCESYSNWTGWSNWTTASCSAGDYKVCESEIRYFMG